jgi:hypothetical protein
VEHLVIGVLRVERLRDTLLRLVGLLLEALCRSLPLLLLDRRGRSPSRLFSFFCFVLCCSSGASIPLWEAFKATKESSNQLAEELSIVTGSARRSFPWGRPVVSSWGAFASRIGVSFCWALESSRSVVFLETTTSANLGVSSSYSRSATSRLRKLFCLRRAALNLGIIIFE